MYMHGKWRNMDNVNLSLLDESPVEKRPATSSVQVPRKLMLTNRARLGETAKVCEHQCLTRWVWERTDFFHGKSFSYTNINISFFFFDSLGLTATNCLYFPVFVTVQPHRFLGLLHHSFSWSQWRPVLQRFGPLRRIHKRNMNKTVKKYSAYVWIVSKVDSAKSIFCIT